MGDELGDGTGEIIKITDTWKGNNIDSSLLVVWQQKSSSSLGKSGCRFTWKGF